MHVFFVCVVLKQVPADDLGHMSDICRLWLKLENYCKSFGKCRFQLNLKLVEGLGSQSICSSTSLAEYSYQIDVIVKVIGRVCVGVS